MKKFAPGCRCFIGYSWIARATSVRVHCSSDSTGWTTLNLSTITALGSGAVAVGVDIENRLLLSQKTDGSVYTVGIRGRATTLLWGTSTDAATKSWRRIKHFPSWGISVGKATDETVYGIDNAGAFTLGPYTMASPESATNGIAADSSGNVYYRGLNRTTSGVDYHTVNQNGSEYGSFDWVALGVNTDFYHDGTDLFVNTTPTPAPSGIYLVLNGTVTTTSQLLFEAADIAVASHWGGFRTLHFDVARDRLYVNLQSSSFPNAGISMMSPDLSIDRRLWVGGVEAQPYDHVFVP